MSKHANVFFKELAVSLKRPGVLFKLQLRRLEKLKCSKLLYKYYSQSYIQTPSYDDGKNLSPLNLLNHIQSSINPVITCSYNKVIRQYELPIEFKQMTFSFNLWHEFKDIRNIIIGFQNQCIALCKIMLYILHS